MWNQFLAFGGSVCRRWSTCRRRRRVREGPSCLWGLIKRQCHYSVGNRVMQAGCSITVETSPQGTAQAIGYGRHPSIFVPQRLHRSPCASDLLLKGNQLRFTGFVHDFSSLFSLSQELGYGRFGTVYLATDLRSQESVACKRIPKDADLDLEEVLNEIEISGQMSHPHVLKVNDVLEDESYIYLMSDRCDGGELFDRIVKFGHFTEKTAAEFARQLLLALKYIHDNRVVHRDVKPENLLFLNKSRNSPLVLIDFGMARILEPGKHFTASCGSPSYVAPEVLQEWYDEKCDIWSAGVILFVTLSGRMPFGGHTDQEIMRNVSSGKYDFKDQAWRYISDEAKDLVQNMLCKDPSYRFSASQCLEHPWIKYSGLDNYSLLISAMSNLRSLTMASKFKTICTRLIASRLAHNKGQDKISEVIRNAFARLDVNRDGLVPIKVIANAIMEESPALKVSDSVESIAQLLGERFDRDHDLCLGFEDFASAALDLIPLQGTHLREAFTLLDKNNDKMLSFDELLLEYYNREGPVDENLLRSEFSVADLDGDGAIAFDDFERYLRHSLV